jgi:hypothetical protein
LNTPPSPVSCTVAPSTVQLPADADTKATNWYATGATNIFVISEAGKKGVASPPSPSASACAKKGASAEYRHPLPL